MATLAPSLAKRRAMPRPMPELPPVTMATLSLNLMSLPLRLQLISQPDRSVAEEALRRLKQLGLVDAAMDAPLPEHPVRGRADGPEPLDQPMAVVEQRVELGSGHQ